MASIDTQIVVVLVNREFSKGSGNWAWARTHNLVMVLNGFMQIICLFTVYVDFPVPPHCWIQSGRGGANHTPPLGPNFFNFHAVFMKNGQIIGW